MPTYAADARYAALAIIKLLNTPLKPPVRWYGIYPDRHPQISEWLIDADGVDGWSSGERVLLGIVRAVYNGTGSTALTDLRLLDTQLRAKVLAILTEAWT